MKPFLGLFFFLFLVMSASAKGPVYHIVHFKFHEETTGRQVRNVEKEFAALQKSIPVIQSFEWGTDISPEKLSQGFKHCWVIVFNNEKDRDIYLEHPEHKKFVSLVKPLLKDALVVDFIPRRHRK